jgi:hypothetical protein
MMQCSVLFCRFLVEALETISCPNMDSNEEFSIFVSFETHRVRVRKVYYTGGQSPRAAVHFTEFSSPQLISHLIPYPA